MSLRQESSYPWFQPRLIGVVVISTAAVASTAIVVGGWKATHAAPQTPHTINIAADAKQHVTPDHLTWTVTVHAKSYDRDSAITDLRESVDKARTYLTSHGVQEAELAIKPSSVEEPTKDSSTDDETATTTGEFDASQQLVITSADVGRALKAYRDTQTAEDLVGADQEEPTCTVAGIDALQTKLESQARHNVRAKAAATAGDYGAHLGKLVETDGGSFDAGTTGVDGCTGADATATAHATFELE
jgi:hypothetical protein